MLEFGPMPNRLFPAQLPCYEGQPGELKADPYIFVLTGAQAAFVRSERVTRVPGWPGMPRRAKVKVGASDAQVTSLIGTLGTLVVVNTRVCIIIHYLSVRMTPGGPGCGLQIRRRCEVAEAQLLLSDERSERLVATITTITTIFVIYFAGGGQSAWSVT